MWAYLITPPAGAKMAAKIRSDYVLQDSYLEIERQ